MQAKTIMIQGTSSGVGKSIISTAICRYFYEEGYKVAPFKSQNLSLNSYVTCSGDEISCAQGIQAEAAKIEATVNMNPILLKPNGETKFEVIIQGSHFTDVESNKYRQSELLNEMLKSIKESFNNLLNNFELLVIEGSGSPVEMNLKNKDISNMFIADLAGAPVLLVADIDRGGVFASIIGTLELLEPYERKRVEGIIINKFHGDVDCFQSGVNWLERKIGLPILGILPYSSIHLDSEGSLSLEHQQKNKDADIHIAVIKFPHISNFTDFLPLTMIPTVNVSYIEKVEDIEIVDAIILPGTKNTINDLIWLENNGLKSWIKEAYQHGREIVGICGGYQMLGDHLEDLEKSKMPGLDLMPIKTKFTSNKKVTRVKGTSNISWARNIPIEGYELHFGRCKEKDGYIPWITLEDGRLEGCASHNEQIWGSYLHGLFDNNSFSFNWINHLRKKKGLTLLQNINFNYLNRETEYKKLSNWIRENMDMERIKQIVF